jgi:hypothetical protein
MDCDQRLISVVFILGLMLVGMWLERINGKHGFWDEMLTPIPMGLAGAVMLLEKAWWVWLVA